MQRRAAADGAAEERMLHQVFRQKAGGGGAPEGQACLRQATRQASLVGCGGGALPQDALRPDPRRG